MQTLKQRDGRFSRQTLKQRKGRYTGQTETSDSTGRRCQWVETGSGRVRAESESVGVLT